MSLDSQSITLAGLPRSGPSSLSEILDGAFRAYRRHFVVLASLSLLVQLPVVIATATRATGVTGLLNVFVTPLMLAVLFVAAADIFAGRTPTIGAAFRAGLRRYVSYLGVFLMYILVVFAFVIPPLGLWLAVRWALAPSAIATESLKANAALKRSVHLVTGMWWQTFGILATVIVLNLVLVVILSFTAGLIVGLVPLPDQATSILVGRAVGGMVGTLVTPIVPLAQVLLFLDLRVRKEGTDLDGLARSAGQAA